VASALENVYPNGMTDCLSMEVMLDHASTEAATPDRHFAQAGFRILMSAP
jgi:hypothetical protein